MDVLEVEAAQPSSGDLEIVELELALKHQDFIELGFEGTVSRALDRIGGTLLFQMRMNGIAGCDWVAAVALNAGEERRYAIVAQPTNGEGLLVEDVETSDIPVAGIAPAYAKLMDTLSIAA